MSEITILASSKPFRILTIPLYLIFFFVQEIDEYWEEKVNGLFSMPYVYEAEGYWKLIVFDLYRKVYGIR